MVKPDSKLKRISTEIHVCVYVCTRNEDNVDYSALKLAMDASTICQFLFVSCFPLNATIIRQPPTRFSSMTLKRHWLFSLVMKS